VRKLLSTQRHKEHQFAAIAHEKDLAESHEKSAPALTPAEPSEESTSVTPESTS